jgi:two-component system, chemotaxis family, response regulator Rcp1
MTTQTPVKPIDILLVEDNEGDARLAREALRESKILNTIHHVRDGVEAMEMLHRVGRFAKSPRPDLVLLDLNLPRKDGRQVLAEIKQDEQLKRIPVVILTVSNDANDVLTTYGLHANCYITKPLDLDQFFRVVRSIEDFWLTIVRLPDSEGRQ